MSYNELQDDYASSSEFSFSSRADIHTILSKADILSSPKAPKLPHADRRAILEARYHVREYILRHQDKPYAFWEVFLAVYGNRLTTNAWTGQVYLYQHNDNPRRLLSPYKDPTSPEKLVSDLEDALEMSSKMRWEDFKRKLACRLGEGGFNPVKEYLEEVAKKHPEPMTEWDNLAAQLFGVDDPLSQEMLTKWLIGAVARAMQPGCQMRQCLVLKGGQEVGKSQLLRALFGEYYASRDSEMKDADVYRQLKACWGMELEEMEAIASKRSVENLKRFISVQEDEWVIKYKEDAKKHPRHSVFAGTVNSDEFLRDETGNSRFWVIDIGANPANVDYARINRDRIWAEAYRRWVRGEKYWDRELSQKAQERANNYRTSNEYLAQLEPIMAELERRYGDNLAVRVPDLLTYAFNVPVERHKANKADSKMAQALVSLGYERKQVGESKTWAYRKPSTKPTEVLVAVRITEAKLVAEQWGLAGKPDDRHRKYSQG